MVFGQLGHKSLVDKPLDHRPRFRQDVPLSIDLELRLQPDNHVRDIWLRGVGPIVPQDPEVVWMGEWRRVAWRNLLSVALRTRPMEPFLADKIDDAAVFGFGLLGPGEVTAKCGWVAFEGRKVVVGLSGKRIIF